jgi:hypothetical protein
MKPFALSLLLFLPLLVRAQDSPEPRLPVIDLRLHALDGEAFAERVQVGIWTQT